MTAQSGSPSRHVRLVSAKTAYSETAGKKLVESKAKFDGVRAAIRHAVATGSLKPCTKLECAQRAVEARITIAEARLEALQKSGGEGWEHLRDELEDAWEDLSHSMNKLVARIKDGSV